MRIVTAAGGHPPAADRFHGESGGVVVGADVDPPGVGGQVVDPVRDGLALERLRMLRFDDVRNRPDAGVGRFLDRSVARWL